MDILLHTPSGNNNLSIHYTAAFKNAVELFVVTAYLTEWDSSLALNPSCRTFRIIIGSDFGITRKAACEKVMRWLPSNQKSKFLVADSITGFHPKAVFWKELPQRSFPCRHWVIKPDPRRVRHELRGKYLVFPFRGGLQESKKMGR